MIHFIDLFCGAGGVSTGVEQAEIRGQKVAHVIACVNHDRKAIDSHRANHGHVKHYTEDIRTLNLNELRQQVSLIRATDPDAIIGLWASMECTNFSKAKGGLPRDADSRTLALDMPRYIEALRPEYFWFENVEEFMSWGPLDVNGKPVSRDAGRDYVKWCNNIQNMGYAYDYRKINSADHGAYTSRRRLFGVFASHGYPIAWPEASHAKNPGHKGMFGELQKWKAVKDVLDLDDHGKSIFGRKKPLKEKSLKRVYEGLIKNVAGGEKQFLIKYNSMSKNGKYHPGSVENPLPVIPTRNMHYLVTAQFLNHYYGSGGQQSSIENPAPTIPTKARTSIITAQFINRDFTNGGNNSSIDSPAGSVMPFPKMNLVTSIILNPQWNSAGGSIEKPCPVIIARQDKAPLYLISFVYGPCKVAVYDTDSPMTVKIKEFMAMYGIADILMRMLKVSELLKIQGFPAGYVLVGSQADQKKFIGNSVVPLVAQRIMEAIASVIPTHQTEVA